MDGLQYSKQKKGKRQAWKIIANQFLGSKQKKKTFRKMSNINNYD